MKHARPPQGPRFGVKLSVFLFVSVLWCALDRLTKLWADRAQPGDVLVDDVLGLFEFRLVHNTGAAWGIFSESTFALGVFSLAVCAFILLALFTYVRKEGSMLEVVSLALVFAGGIGNAVDRLTNSYVIDFIHTTFMSFPVFNVADIGVTCGIALFLIGMFTKGDTVNQKDA